MAWTVSGGCWNDWTRYAGRHLRGRVVEVGPGPGHLLAHLRAGGVPAVGIELSGAMARLAGGQAPGAVARADGRCLPLRSGAVDAVVVTFPGPYVLEPSFWAEAARVVRPGGRLRILLDAGPAYASRGSQRVVLLAPGWRVRRARVKASDVTLGLLLARRP